MIDLHCHILPNIDDGPNTLKESLEMARFALDSGITHVLCTPHHKNGRFDNTKETILKNVAFFQKKLEESKIELVVFAGQEIRMNPDILKDYEDGKLLTIDIEGRYILIELPVKGMPSYTEKLLFQLIINGLIPVIVHPERSDYFMKDPKRLIPFLNMGCLSQVTASSYVGEFGKKVQKTAKLMVKKNLVQMIASDAHGTIKRRFMLKEAYDHIEKKFGEEKAAKMKRVAVDVLNGSTVRAENYN